MTEEDHLILKAVKQKGKEMELLNLNFIHLSSLSALIFVLGSLAYSDKH
jgi:hypothetical protein